MNAQEVGGVIRAAIAGVGGVLIAFGYTDEQTVSLIAGTATTLGVAVWSIIDKRRKG